MEQEAELKQLLEEYGMEERTDNGVVYVWYKGSDLKAEGLAVEAGSRKEAIETVLDYMHRNPQWKKREAEPQNPPKKGWQEFG